MEIVEALAHVADLVFRIGQLRLELLEVRIRLQLRISLRNREQRLQRTAQSIIGFHFRLGSRCVGDGRTRSDDLLKRARLMRGVAFHRFDQIGNKVATSLQLHVDLRPGVVDHIAHFHEVVVQHDRRNNEHDDNRENNSKYHDFAFQTEVSAPCAPCAIIIRNRALAQRLRNQRSPKRCVGAPASNRPAKATPNPESQSPSPRARNPKRGRQSSQRIPICHTAPNKLGHATCSMITRFCAEHRGSNRRLAHRARARQ